MTEQRKSKRFRLRLPFELLKAGSLAIRDCGETKNVSSGGVLFTAATAIEVGASIEYLITLPTGTPVSGEVRIRCMGKVVRAEPGMERTADRPGVALAATLERYEFVRAAR